MAKQEHTIVRELLELDPSLQAHRAALEKNVRALLLARPDTKFSAGFQKRLLRSLRETLELESSSTSFPFFTMMHKFLYTGGGAVIGAFIAFAVIHTLPELNTFPDTEMKDNGPNAMRMMDENHEVGMANDLPSIAPAPSMMDPTMNSRPQSAGGGGGGMMAVPATTEPMMYGEGDAKMIAPYPEYQPVAVDFKYEGELKLPKGDVTVLRRSTPTMTENGSVLKDTFASSLFNVSKVPGLKMQSVSLTQETKTPYFINIDFQNGTVSINKNIDYSSRPESKCTDDACYARYRMKMNDMPSDSALITKTDAFMKEFNIDMSSLSSPMVQEDWRYWYEATPDKSNYWLPEQLTVVYPYAINGKPVYDEWGNALGVNVTFDIRENAVTGVWGLQTMQFQSSTYAAAEDVDAVEKVIREGGRNAWRDPSSKILESKLKDPIDAYVQIYTWDQKNLNGETLYVPALAFPVESMPMEANMVKRFVLVPLAEELLQGDQQYPGEPRPMMMEGAAG